jgi:hypothetical protein
MEDELQFLLPFLKTNVSSIVFLSLDHFSFGRKPSDSLEFNIQFQYEIQILKNL